MAADGSGRVILEYRVPKVLEALDLYTGTYGGLPFPLNKAGLDRRVLAVPGISIQSWLREDASDIIRISSELRFTSLSSLAEFMIPYGQRLEYTAVDGRRELRISLDSGTPPSPDAAAWAMSYWANYSVALSVSLPSRAVSVNPGTLSASGTLARFSSPTVDLVRRTEPLAWTIRW